MDEKMSLLEQRKERMAKTLRREKTDKIPFLFLADSYIPYYAGVDMRDITSYEYAVEVNKKVTDDLNPDCGSPYLPQNLVLSPKLDLLGGGAHEVSNTMVKQIVPSAVEIMKADEYGALINDPTNYLLEEMFPRRYKLLANNNADEKYNKIIQVLGEGQKIGEYVAKWEEETQVASFMYGGTYVNPVDIILDLLRNFNGMIGDIRRQSDMVRDAGLAMVDSIAKIMKFYQPVESSGLLCPMHLPTFVKAKDFEKVYWPSFKKLTELIVDQGHNIIFMFEKNYSHLYDYLQDLPKQHISGIFNKDDIYVVQKKLGSNMTIFGGLSANILNYGTKQECIDHVITLIDNLGRDGGYCIAPDTPLLFPVDAKPENLKIAVETINSYGIN